VKLVGSPGFKTSRFLLVRKARRFNQAQVSGQWRGGWAFVFSFYITDTFPLCGLCGEVGSAKVEASRRCWEKRRGHVEMLHFSLSGCGKRGREGMNFGDPEKEDCGHVTSCRRDTPFFLFYTADYLPEVLPRQPHLHPQFKI
jgi:hypothetical protein